LGANSVNRQWLVSAALIVAVATVSPQSVLAADDARAQILPKRLVLCLDGTWAGAYNEAKRRDGHTVLKPANPLKLCRAVVPIDERTGRIQISYYHVGVGGLAEYPGFSNRLLQRADRILGGGWGAGFEENVEGALHFLALNFEAEDEVFVFGFSRGAATARAVTRFLEWNHGLPEKEDVYYLPRLFRKFVMSHAAARAWEEELAAINADRQRELRPLAPLKPFRQVRVKYLGVWDTVMALGSRFAATEDSTSSPTRTFYAGTAPAAVVEHARQALAVDERRFDFRPEIWTEHLPHQTMEQRWFAGVHSNVGGGYRHDGLANITLHWVLAGATAQGLKVDTDFIAHYRPYDKHNLYDSYSFSYWVLEALRLRFGGGRRSLVDLPATANAVIDPSVIERMQAMPSQLGAADEPRPTEPYRPENVLLFLARQRDLGAYLKAIGVPDGENVPLPADVKRRLEELKRRSGSELGRERSAVVHHSGDTAIAASETIPEQLGETAIRADW
jgi:uncharacterized protein (DUF2235 family)